MFNFILRKFTCIMQIRQTNWLHCRVTLFALLRCSLSLSPGLILALQRCCWLRCALFPFGAHTLQYLRACVCKYACITSFTFVEFGFFVALSTTLGQGLIAAYSALSLALAAIAGCDTCVREIKEGNRIISSMCVWFFYFFALCPILIHISVFKASARLVASTLKFIPAR